MAAVGGELLEEILSELRNVCDREADELKCARRTKQDVRVRLGQMATSIERTCESLDLGPKDKRPRRIEPVDRKLVERLSELDRHVEDVAATLNSLEQKVPHRIEQIEMAKLNRMARRFGNVDAAVERALQDSGAARPRVSEAPAAKRARDEAVGAAECARAAAAQLRELLGKAEAVAAKLREALEEEEDGREAAEPAPSAVGDGDGE